MTRFDVTTIGEGQLRYCVPAGKRLEQVEQFDVHVTGTELNVVTLLSRLGWKTGWVSALPKTPLGRRVLQPLRMSNTDCDAVQWVENGRLATYYVEFAVPPRSSQVYYDRANTPFTQLTIDDIDWEYLLDTKLLHISGLTLPLSPNIFELLTEAVVRAKARGVKVSFDMNYRTRLWSPDAALAGVKDIISQVDVLFFGRRDAQQLFDADDDPKAIVQKLATMSGAENIVVSLSADGLIGWDRATDTYTHAAARKVEIIDRIGAGDAMVGGVLHGWLSGDLAKGLRYGVLTAAMALSQHKDQVVTNREEIDLLVDQKDGLDITR